LEAEALESVDLKNCILKHLGLVSKGTLRILRIEDARFSVLDIGPDTSMLEALHVSYAKTRWPGLGDFVSKTPNLKELQFKGIPLCLDFRTIRQRFTRSNHLAIPLDYEAMKGNIDKVLLSQSCHTYLIEKVVLVELESTRALNDKFCHGIEAFLKVCPSLKRLVVWANTLQA
jgi:hypothetical protein